MVRRSTAQVEAREQARARLAERHAAARAREKANEDDLIAFLALDAQKVTAAVTRDDTINAVIASANATYDEAVATIESAQSQSVAAMVARGETAADVADLTGWSLKQVRAATKSAPAAPTDESSEPTPDTDGTEASAPADSPDTDGEQQAP